MKSCLKILKFFFRIDMANGMLFLLACFGFFLTENYLLSIVFFFLILVLLNPLQKNIANKILKIIFCLLLFVSISSSSFFVVEINWHNFSYIFIPLFFLALLIFSQRNRISCIESEIEEERRVEKKEKDMFFVKHAQAAKFPFLRRILQQIYSHGIKYSVLIIAMLSLSGFLYFYNLGNYGFQGDEYYIVKESQTFFDTGKLFYAGEEQGGRSKISTLLAIFSESVFSLLPFSLNEEFIYRLPFALSAFIGSFFFFRLARIYLPKKIALIATLIFITEIWFIYFARYARFYGVSLMFISIFLYYTHVFYHKKYFLYGIIAASVLLFFFLQAYFILIAGFIFLILLQQYFFEKKYNHVILIILSGTLVLGGLYLRNYILYGGNIYSDTNWSFNVSNLATQIKWALMNYGHFFILFVPSIYTLSSNRKNILVLFSWVSVLFFLFYINSVPFNFTFRPIYFFLPFVMILGIRTLYSIFYNSKFLFYSFLTLILLGNIFNTAKYFTGKNGDIYHPTKLVFEKHSLIFGNNEIANFLNQYIEKNNINNYKIISIGLGDISLYSKLKIDQSYEWGQGNYQEFVTTLLNAHEKIFIIIHATGYCNDTNRLYRVMWKRDCVTEASESYFEYLRKNPQYIPIYNSGDGYSKIYSNLN